MPTDMHTCIHSDGRAHTAMCLCVCVCVSLPFVKSAAFDYCLVIHKSVALSDESVTLSYLLTSTEVLA
jgi:hypothetical protein